MQIKITGVQTAIERYNDLRKQGIPVKLMISVDYIRLGHIQDNTIYYHMCCTDISDEEKKLYLEQKPEQQLFFDAEDKYNLRTFRKELMGRISEIRYLQMYDMRDNPVLIDLLQSDEQLVAQVEELNNKISIQHKEIYKAQHKYVPK